MFFLNICFVGDYDSGKLFFIEKSESIGGALGRCRFEIVEGIFCLLIIGDAFSHVGEYFFGKCLSFFRRDICL